LSPPILFVPPSLRSGSAIALAREEVGEAERVDALDELRSNLEPLLFGQTQRSAKDPSRGTGHHHFPRVARTSLD
jgi:hypothetical protein